MRKVSRIFPDRIGILPKSIWPSITTISMIDYWFHLFWNKTRTHQQQ